MNSRIRRPGPAIVAAGTAQMPAPSSRPIAPSPTPSPAGSNATLGPVAAPPVSPDPTVAAAPSVAPAAGGVPAALCPSLGEALPGVVPDPGDAWLLGPALKGVGVGDVGDVAAGVGVGV